MTTSKLIIASICYILIAVTSPRAQSNKLPVDIDVICYPTDSNSVRVDAYYSLLQKSVLFNQTEKNRWAGKIKASVSLIQDDIIKVTKDIDKTVTLSGTQEDIKKTENQYFIDAVPFIVSYSKNSYLRLLIHLVDESGAMYVDSVVKRFTLPQNTSGQPSISGILLASGITQTGRDESLFEKAGYYFTVNPSVTFGGEYTSLNYYTEFRIPKTQAAPSDSITVVSTIYEPSMRELLRNEQTIVVGNDITPYIASLNIDGLPTDSYYLEVACVLKGVTITKARKVFYVENDMILSEENESIDASLLDETTLFQVSEISKMSENELNEKIAQASYILPDAEREALNEAKELQTKQKLFFAFWRSMNLNPVQPFSAYNEYFKKVAYANQKFTYQRMSGWKTDRGRIYITYGAPSDVESELFSTQAKPYIQWEYVGKMKGFASGGRAYFYFVDRMGGGNFNLVHSNVIGEVSDPNWYQNTALQIR